MAHDLYRARDATATERLAAVEERRRLGRPWHAPPHFRHDDPVEALFTAACYRHAPHIGRNERRLDAFSSQLLDSIAAAGGRVRVWCVLPNHYHALVRTDDLACVASALGRLHGRCSHAWNAEDATPGRVVFHGVSDRRMRTEAHVWTTVNYVHANPVRHGHARRATEWRWSSAAAFVAAKGREAAVRLWRRYPVGTYGAGWDDGPPPDTA